MPMPTVDQARNDLIRILERGVNIEANPQGTTSTEPVRRSAVLILFGSLDRTPSYDAPTTVSPDLDVLLMRRSNKLRHHAGEISFPGGKIEETDNDPVSAALREANEETGLDPAGVEILGQLPEIPIIVSNSLVTPIIAWWRLPSEVRADKSESVEVFRVPVAEMINPIARGTSEVKRGRNTYRGAAFELGPQLGRRVVWGFTGILLSTLYDELGWSLPWDRSRIFPLGERTPLHN